MGFKKSYLPTVDDAFDVEHGYYFEHVSVSSFFRGDSSSAKVFDHAIDYPRSAGLTGMHARSQVHDRPVLRLQNKTLRLVAVASTRVSASEPLAHSEMSGLTKQLLTSNENRFKNKFIVS